MTKLFIIGNGFDLAHGLATSYDKFRKYLCDTYMNGKKGQDYMTQLPPVMMGPKGETFCDMEEVAEFLVGLISIAEPDENKWSDLEASLGRLDYDEVFELLPEQLDNDGDIDCWKTVYNNQDIASNLRTVVSYVKAVFAEWVDTIDIESAEAERGFLTLIEPDDIFLTFNYTETLEKVYSINKDCVCHIHGKQGGDILFGHGNTEDYTEKYMIRNVGAEDSLTALNNFLRKNTKQALEEHRYFWEKIDNTIKEVYSIGFSFADVDLIYIKEICSKLSEDVVWYLNDFNPSELPVYQEKIIGCGFKGDVASFNM